MCPLQDSGVLAGKLNGWGVSNIWGLETCGSFFTHMADTWQAVDSQAQLGQSTRAQAAGAQYPVFPICYGLSV